MPLFTVLGYFSFFKSIRAEGSLGRAYLKLQAGSESRCYGHPVLATAWQHHIAWHISPLPKNIPAQA